MTLISTATLAVKAATLLIGKLAIIPIIIATLAYYNYDLMDPENQPKVTKNLRKEYDFVVVGGGSAGSVVVNRLTENPGWSVLLLEAGGHETEITDVPILSLYLHKSKLDWKYRTQPQDSACQAMVDRRCCWTRGKVLGGSSVLNTMLYIRGNRRDFDQWESFGNPGWGYDDILHYFKKSQDQRNPYLARNTKYHSTGGYLTVQDSPYNTPLGIAFLQAGEEMGYDIVDINGEQQTGFALYQYTMRRGTRCSAAKAFIRPIQLRRNFDLSLWSHVTRILIDPRTKRARGVEFIRGGRREVVHARKEVILSAGAINSPQLLMLSGIGPRRHLEELGIPVIHDSPGVGQNLQDHIAVGGIIFPIDYPISIMLDRVVNLNSALRYAITEDGPLTANVGLETVGFISTKYANRSDDWPDIEFMLTSSSVNSDGGTHVKNAHGLTDEFYNEVFESINRRDVFSVFPMLLQTKDRAVFLKLRSSNPLDYPSHVSQLPHRPVRHRRVEGGGESGDRVRADEQHEKVRREIPQSPGPQLQTDTVVHGRVLELRDTPVHDDHLPYELHGQDGAADRSHGGRGSRAKGVRGERVEGDRRVHHAHHHQRKYKRACDNDRREGGRFG
ncbi:glucose dehydrogenase [FAD, quinone] [Apis mellifera carnica]|nr:glucose dehydrogenase [FAD, quinone] [Apis mellifera carnica]